MGLLLAGTASDKAAELLAYARDTQHEKIIRGLAVRARSVTFANFCKYRAVGVEHEVFVT